MSISNTIRWCGSAVFLFAIFFFLPLPACKSETLGADLPYKDPSLPISERVDDLVSRMTLEEKVAQLMDNAPPVESLGIPHYNWWNEALHGVARAGYATVFPQAIGLAATWDVDLMNQVADTISTEARAKNNEFVRLGERGRYKGLTFWSPNINILRDPRWGRGQETYGEDPYLTSQMAVAFVKGLQGSDPRYLKAIATPKHFAVHSGPEPLRHSFDGRVTERDLRETYLPAFRAAVIDGQAASVMCAYNSVNGDPACANSKLLSDILRREWKFGGYVVSDCGAIKDVFDGHHFANSELNASILALKAGTDLDCDAEYKTLVAAVQNGSVSEADIDTSLKRLMVARFRLGMFDPPGMVPYTQIPYSENDSTEHRQLALKAARESIVLLKNANGTLPLSKSVKTIAVIGPNANESNVLLGSYNGQASKLVTPLGGIQGKVDPTTTVLYSPGMYEAGVAVEPIPSTFLVHGREDPRPGVKGEYFNNRDLSGEPALVRDDSQANFDWGEYSPASGVNKDNFSARWSGRLIPPRSGAYLLGFRGNGGARLYVDGKEVVEDFVNRRGIIKTATDKIFLEAGHQYDIRLEYFENSNSFAAAQLVWSPPGAADLLKEDALGKARQADVIVMVMGISPVVEGEERDINIAGFRGGDRTDITLPKDQEDLIKEIQALGKPVVLVLTGGSSLAVNWADKHVPAIIDAWYPGEEGGTAIADVLFGDYNPSGRLPMTFYKSVDQLPPFEDYSMQGRTYRYFKGRPLYPFGFGLSYTKFTYSNLTVSPKTVGSTGRVTVTADVENVGKSGGGEVVELYLRHVQASVPVPIRSLQGLSRIFLQPGEKRRVSFSLEPRQFSLIDNHGDRVVELGEFVVTVGGGQPALRGQADSRTGGIVKGRFHIRGTVARIEQE